jgi:hypothetical protein
VGRSTRSRAMLLFSRWIAVKGCNLRSADDALDYTDLCN